MNADLLQRKSFIITLGLLTAVAALTVDLSLPAIPAMVQALDTSLSRGQQIVGIFMIGMACGQIPAGLFSDRLGRLPTLYVGMTIFAIAAIVAASADNMDVLLVARFVQGIGAASAIVLSRAIVRDVASGKDAARLMSLMTMIFTVAPVVAPSIGALLVAAWGWRAPFIVIACRMWANTRDASCNRVFGNSFHTASPYSRCCSSSCPRRDSCRSLLCQRR